MNKNFFLTDRIVIGTHTDCFYYSKQRETSYFSVCLKPTWGSFNDVAVKVLKQYAQKCLLSPRNKSKTGTLGRSDNVKIKVRVPLYMDTTLIAAGTAAVQAHRSQDVCMLACRISLPHTRTYIFIFLPPDAESKHASVRLYASIHTQVLRNTHTLFFFSPSRAPVRLLMHIWWWFDWQWQKAMSACKRAHVCVSVQRCACVCVCVC